MMSIILAVLLSKDLMVPINGSLVAANSNIPGMFDSYTADDVVVVDDFAPYVWRGKGAMSAWWRSFEQAWPVAHISGVHAEGHDITQYKISADAAWIVVPLTITYTKAEKLTTLNGLWIFTLQKVGADWKITTVTWGTATRT